jgi:hypothetical protein
MYDEPFLMDTMEDTNSLKNYTIDENDLHTILSELNSDDDDTSNQPPPPTSPLSSTPSSPTLSLPVSSSSLTKKFQCRWCTSVYSQVPQT